MAIFIPWLADAAKMTGYPVIEEKNWRIRGAGGQGMVVVEGVVGHHTAGPKTGEYPCRNIILNGRPGLPGPLSHYGLGRSGSIYVVGAGRANHAGVSAWGKFKNLNDKFVGIEAEDDGDAHWTPEQIDCYPRLVAAILYYMRRDESRYAGHKDVALPLGRKPDPNGINSDGMRAQVKAYLANPSTIRKGNAPPPIVPTNVPVRVLRAGDRGEDVRWVQTRLVYWGFPVATDGAFGPNTEKAVRSFQTSRRIESDGVVGKVTVSHLGQNKTVPTPILPKEEPVTEAEMDRIVEKLYARLQPKGGEPLGNEVDMLRRDMRELGNAIGMIMYKMNVNAEPLVPRDNTTVDGIIES